jgi:riboflavin biosynthesis pyrimidine reductase
VRRLLPDPLDDVDPAEVYDVPRPAPEGRPWVLANMISSLDGSATADGRSGGLGGDADRRVFRLLRRLADVIVVAAGTVRAEHYGPVRGPDPAPIAVVTRSIDLDLDSSLFTEAVARPIVLTCEAADPERRKAAEAVADVVVAGGPGVELPLALAELHARGHRVALCEGGPTLLAEMVSNDLVDELCLTLAPVLVAGAGPRILKGPPLTDLARFSVASVLEEDGALFLRYLREVRTTGPSARSTS